MIRLAVPLCLLFFCPQLKAQENSIAVQYLDSLTALWEEDASSVEIDALGRLLADGAVYQHPRFEMRMEGRSTILAAMTQFLGTSRAPHVSDVVVLNGSGVTVLAFDLSMEVRGEDGWRRIERHQVAVLEVFDGKITRISDYW